MSKCFIQIVVQNSTTINAFTEAQKFIIISVISKGFRICLAREISQHSSFSFHRAGFEGLLRTRAKLVTTSNIYLHIKSPLWVPNVFPLSGDSLWLTVGRNRECSSEIRTKSGRLKSTVQPLVNTQGSGEGGAKVRFMNSETLNTCILMSKMAHFLLIMWSEIQGAQIPSKSFSAFLDISA